MEAVVKEYTASATDVVKFYFVTALEYAQYIFQQQSGHKPEMTHQIFGDSETVFGYKDLEIKIAYNVVTGHCLVKLDHSAVVTGFNLVADDIWSKLRLGLPEDYTKTYFDFAALQNTRDAALKTFGVPKFHFSCCSDYSKLMHFVTHLCSVDEPGFSAVHKRFQTLLLWYIDGANFIDLNDPNWEIIYLYTSEGSVPALAGFCTVYKFYAHSDQIRARISQFLIFPNYQRKGVGPRFLRCVYAIIRDTIENLKDITVEDPNENFRLIRSVNNFHQVLYSPAMSKFVRGSTSNGPFEAEIVSLFKFSKKDSQLIAELMAYIWAHLNNLRGGMRRLLECRKKRFKKQFCRVKKHYRDSIKYKRAAVAEETIKDATDAYKAEFLTMVCKIEERITDNFAIVKDD